MRTVAARCSLGSTNSVEICAQEECCARYSVNERESTASGTRESKLLRRHWMDLMLKVIRLNTASQTGVKG